MVVVVVVVVEVAAAVVVVAVVVGCASDCPIVTHVAHPTKDIRSTAILSCSPDESMINKTWSWQHSCGWWWQWR